jgi:hypothetical protein
VSDDPSDGAIAPLPFVLLRKEDETGVSGTGVVAEGVAFTDGSVALRWTSQWPTSVVFHDKGIESVEHVHGHNGKTQIVRFDFNQQALASVRNLMRATRAEAEVTRLRAKLDAVRALHQPRDELNSVTGEPGCRTCWLQWPCTTYAALDEEET